MLLRSLVVAVCLTASGVPAQYFLATETEARRTARATWLGVSGEQSVVFDYAQPKWRAEHEGALEQPGSHRLLLGAGALTSLRTDVDLAFGELELAKGRWHVCAQRDEHGQWSLVWFDAAKVAASKRPIVHLFNADPDLRVPVRVTRAAELVERFEITLEESRGTPHNLVLAIAWGPYRMRTDVAAAFDLRKPDGMPAFARTPEGKGSKTASGLVYEPLVAGTGAPPGADDLVHAHYACWLSDGTLIDSTYARGGPVPLRPQWVDAGFAEALRLMPPGATYRLTIPPELGVGGHGTRRAPPNATLVYVVTIVGDGGR